MELKEYRRCDFCNEFEAPFLWAFSNQTIPAGTPIDLVMEFISHPEWFACKDCHNKLLRQDLMGLVANVPENQRPYFTKLYSSLIQNTQRN